MSHDVGRARLLSAARQAAGLSQEDLSSRSGVSERTIRSLESGRAKRPHEDTLVALARALELSDDRVAAFVAAWRQPGRSILDLFDDAPSEHQLRDALAVQRRAIREQAASTEVRIGPDRRWISLRTRRVFEVVADEVSTFLCAQSSPTGQHQVELDPDAFVNVAPLDSMGIANARGRAFLLSLGRRYRRGEQCAVGYAVHFGGVTPGAPTDDETLFAVPAPLSMCACQVSFHPDAVPRRAWRVRQPTLDGVPSSGEELAVSPFGVVQVTDLAVPSGVHGIRWDWGQRAPVTSHA